MSDETTGYDETGRRRRRRKSRAEKAREQAEWEARQAPYWAAQAAASGDEAGAAPAVSPQMAAARDLIWRVAKPQLRAQLARVWRDKTRTGEDSSGYDETGGQTVELVVQPTIRLRASRKGGMWTACATLETQGGPVVFTASVREGFMSKLILSKLRKYSPDLAAQLESGDTSGFLSGLRRLAKKVARAKVLSAVMSQVQKVTNNPLIAKAVGLTTVIVPGLRAPMIAIKAASNLVQKAIKGDLTAKNALMELKDRALEGSPEARMAMAVVTKVGKAIINKQPMDLLKGLPDLAQQQLQEYAKANNPLNKAMEFINAAKGLGAGIPGMPQMPGMPGMPQMPGLPGMPGGFPGMPRPPGNLLPPGFPGQAALAGALVGWQPPPNPAAQYGAPWAPVHVAAYHALGLR